MAKDIYVGWSAGSMNLTSAKNKLQSAKNQLGGTSASTLWSFSYEDGAGSGYLFTQDLVSQISGLSGDIAALTKRLDSCIQLVNSGPDALVDIDDAYGNKFDLFGTGVTFLGQAGFFGGILSPALQLFGNPEGGLSGGISALKNGSKIVKNIKKWHTSNKNLNRIARTGINFDGTRLKRLFGLDAIKPSYGKWSGATKWKTRFKNNFYKQDGLFDGFKAGGKKAVLEGAGVALDLFANGLSNYDEYKRGDISKGRAVAETVVETAVDFGKDWLIGTAVAAGIAAVAPAAPVLVVGAATVAVSMGLDFVSKKITYALTGEAKGLTEVISDAALDLAGAACKAAKKAGDKVKAIVKKLPKIKLPKVKLPKLKFA